MKTRHSKIAKEKSYVGDDLEKRSGSKAEIESERSEERESKNASEKSNGSRKSVPRKVVKSKKAKPKASHQQAKTKKKPREVKPKVKISKAEQLIWGKRGKDVYERELIELQEQKMGFGGLGVRRVEKGYGEIVYFGMSQAHKNKQKQKISLMNVNDSAEAIDSRERILPVDTDLSNESSFIIPTPSVRKSIIPPSAESIEINTRKSAERVSSTTRKVLIHGGEQKTSKTKSIVRRATAFPKQNATVRPASAKSSRGKTVKRLANARPKSKQSGKTEKKPTKATKKTKVATKVDVAPVAATAAVSTAAPVASTSQPAAKSATASNEIINFSAVNKETYGDELNSPKRTDSENSNTNNLLLNVLGRPALTYARSSVS